MVKSWTNLSLGNYAERIKIKTDYPSWVDQSIHYCIDGSKTSNALGMEELALHFGKYCK